MIEVSTELFEAAVDTDGHRIRAFTDDCCDFGGREPPDKTMTERLSIGGSQLVEHLQRPL